MRLVYALLSLCFATTSFADTLTLRSGRVVNGTYLGGSPRQVRMEVGDKIESFEISDVSSLQFSAPASAAPAAQTPPPAPALQRGRNPILKPEASAAPARAAKSVEIPSGTAITVRMIDAVDSERNRPGQEFRASLDEPIMVDGEAVVERGADVVVKLVEDKQSGKISGRTELKLDIVSVNVNGKVTDVNTSEVTTASESRGAKSGKVIGGTAALGAIIGAIAGGGKGAAIGAASGAGAGTAVQVLTKGQQVRIPSETRLQFILQDAVRI